jgi:hypothetical protein
MSKSEVNVSDDKIHINDFSNNKNVAKLENYYIKHIDDNAIYTLVNSWGNSSFLNEVINNISDTYGSKENPIILTNVIKAHTLEFIVQYLNYYGKKHETKHPQMPLPTIHISEIFGDEYSLFKLVFDEKKKFSENMIHLMDFIQTANYFNMEYLHGKLCAIIAYLLREFKGNLNEILNTTDP